MNTYPASIRSALRRQSLIPALSVIAALAACSSNPPAAPATAHGPDRIESRPSMNAARPAPSASVESSARSNTLTRNAEPAKHSVYFDYDSSLVKDEYKNVVTANASWVSAHKSRVVIQGNTDERGSREYNLALGQRRADAVKERMTLLGVPARQIETVSFGEEKPRVDSETEQAYTENRRADIMYSGR